MNFSDYPKAATLNRDKPNSMGEIPLGCQNSVYFFAPDGVSRHWYETTQQFAKRLVNTTVVITNSLDTLK